MKSEGGEWTGLSIDLWRDIARRMGVEFEYRELPLRATLDALAASEVDVAPVALTITSEREREIDFSHPYFISGLSLAYPGDGRSAWRETLRAFISPEFLEAVGALAVVLLVAGIAVWLFERGENAEQFDRNPVRGLGDGFWWSAVTMTTVGYGDKAPKTRGGRLVALIWMFTSLIIIASFTASIAASLTANQIASDRLRGRTLPDLRVAVLAGSSAEDFASSQGAAVLAQPTLEEAVEAAVRDRADVVLHDAPVLAYLSRTSHPGLTVSPKTLVRDDFGIGLAPGSGLRERVNAAVLDALHDENWKRIRLRYLGADSAN